MNTSAIWCNLDQFHPRVEQLENLRHLSYFLIADHGHGWTGQRLQISLSIWNNGSALRKFVSICCNTFGFLAISLGLPKIVPVRWKSVWAVGNPFWLLGNPFRFVENRSGCWKSAWAVRTFRFAGYPFGLQEIRSGSLGTRSRGLEIQLLEIRSGLLEFRFALRMSTGSCQTTMTTLCFR